MLIIFVLICVDTGHFWTCICSVQYY